MTKQMKTEIHNYSKIFFFFAVVVVGFFGPFFLFEAGLAPLAQAGPEKVKDSCVSGLHAFTSCVLEIWACALIWC